MQPPPVRKGPYLKTLKHVHTEQIARLQAKNQHECDLLEDIKNFTKQRSAIEKTYAEALLKISSGYLNKKIPSIPDLRDEDEDERWNVWNVWRTVLEENEKLARARLAAVEVFQQQITEDAKTTRHAKLQASKKCLDQLATVQKEVQISVQELDRHKKFYFEEEHIAHDARDRARDAEEKLKKKKGSIFSSFASLQRSSVKFSSKKDACEEKSTGARNDYILALAVANAHQDRYFNVDLDNCLRTLEGDVYDKLKEYLTVLGRTELLTCSAAQNSFTKIRDQAQMYYPVLKQHIRYPFDGCDGDRCTKITCDHGAGHILSREAKKWATKIGKEAKFIRENQKKLLHLQQLKEAGQKHDPDDSSGPDLDTKIDEIKENIRKSETEKCKAEGVIECLRDGNVNVDEWLQDIENLTATLDLPRSSSANSVKTDVSAEHQQQPSSMHDSYYDSESNDVSLENTREVEPHRDSVDHEDDFEAQIEEERKRIESLAATWDDPTKIDWGDEPDTGGATGSVSSPPATSGQVGNRDSWPTDHGDVSEPGVTKCVAMYSYQAQNPDELSIVENEHLELIGEGDGDGWVHARNYKGEEGYVPQNYVEIEGGSAGSGLQPQISFSSVDYHIQETAQTPATTYKTGEFAQETGTNKLPHGDAGITNGYPEPIPPPEEYYGNQNGQGDVTSAPTVTTVSSGGTTPFINELRGDETTTGMFARALYDYEATAPDELSFYEGQIIKILRTYVNEEDDGWWEGEYDGVKGTFPCIVVEECRWDGEPLFPDEEEEEGDDDEEVSDSGINPPEFPPPEAPANLLPPETIVTQPTPETEHPSVQQGKAISASTDKTSFEMELNSDQQQKYQAQFSENDIPGVMVTVTEPENEIEDDIQGDDGSDGLGVAQIVITAATPMSEEPKEFPDPPPPEEEEEEKEDGVEESVPDEPMFEASFADFSQQNTEEAPQVEDAKPLATGAGATVLPDDAFDPCSTVDADDVVVGTKESIPSVSSQESENSSDTVHELPPSQPPPPLPADADLTTPPETVTQLSGSNSASNKQTNRTSLEVEESDNQKKQISLGESSESPVTPEELDIQNLAKLESLKESDA